ncbi:hypothetical protein ACFUJU_15010 [Streptomyces sp. NPDC057235]|uniref:hypothetical protein n=1 Tax=Streptomyces sp. NPDC057235 TaxID=3346058 RepID=UPI0036343ABF
MHDAATWEPLPRLLLQDDAERLAASGGHVEGRVARGSRSVPTARPRFRPGRAWLVGDVRAERDAVDRVRDALEEAGVDGASFVVRAPAPGKALLHLFDTGPAVRCGGGRPPRPGGSGHRRGGGRTAQPRTPRRPPRLRTLTAYPPEIARRDGLELAGMCGARVRGRHVCACRPRRWVPGFS